MFSKAFYLRVIKVGMRGKEFTALPNNKILAGLKLEVIAGDKLKIPEVAEFAQD